MIDSTRNVINPSETAGPPVQDRVHPDPGARDERGGGSSPEPARRSSRRRRGRTGPALVISAMGLLVAAGCSATSAAPDGGSATPGQSLTAEVAAGEASARAALDQGATVIDVRTPEEFAGGHIEDAALVDIQDPSFDEKVATLDDSVTYVVYCRSGNRSAAATERMQDAGLTVLDGGSLGDMTAAGWPVAR